MNQKSYPNQYSSGSTHATSQGRPQPPDLGLNSNLRLSEQNIKAQPPVSLHSTNRMEIEHSNSNKSTNSNWGQYGQQTSSNKDMQIEIEPPTQLEKEKSTTETQKAKILDPRLRNENPDAKKDGTHIKDKQNSEDVERFEKILKKLKKEDSSHKKELKRALDPTELQACFDLINANKSQLGAKYTEYLKRINGYLTDHKVTRFIGLKNKAQKIGGFPPQKFRMNYMIIQALMNSYHEGAKNLMQELTEEIVDLSQESVAHEKNRAVALSKTEESNGTMKGEKEGEHLKVVHVANAEVYKYNQNLKEEEDKLEKIEQAIAEKKAKLNQLSQKILKTEMDSHRSKVKNEFILKFETKLP